MLRLVLVISTIADRRAQQSGSDRNWLSGPRRGAEPVVFGDWESLGWVNRVGSLVLELRDDSEFGPATEILRARDDQPGLHMLAPVGFHDMMFCGRAGLDGSPA